MASSHHHQLPFFFSKLISESPCIYIVKTGVKKTTGKYKNKYQNITNGFTDKKD
jgi:hypothetical protein